MHIRFAQDPIDGKQLIMAGLQRAASRDGHLSRKLSSIQAVEVHAPHPIYDLGADDIALNRSLDAATLVGVSYLIKDDQSNLATAELQVNQEGRATLLSSLQYGFHTEPLNALLELLSAQTSDAQSSSELRILRCGAIGLCALWLKHDGDGGSTLYPLAPTPPGLQADRAYNATEFLESLKHIAARRVIPKADATIP
jgi:hypothetical protein